MDGRPLTELHASLYLGSRAAAAVMNAASVAIFTRMTTTETYGRFVVGFAICFIVYSFCAQWAIYSHFGRFRRDQGARLAGTLIVLIGLSCLAGLAVIAGSAGYQVLAPDLAVACAVLLVCFSGFFGVMEIGRSHLIVSAVALATLYRALFSLLFGCLALWQFGSASALLLGIAAGHAVGALPILFQLRDKLWGGGFVWPQRADLISAARFGWPLLIAFGTAAAAINIDRILLENLSGAAAVAPYGATLDLLKQSFLVVGEAIAVAYISLAKSLHGDDDIAASNVALERAFVTLCYVAVFGVVFFLLLGETFFGLLLPNDYKSVAVAILPILLCANALMMLRAYYFGQVIFFNGSSAMELVASVIMLIVAGVASLLLIGRYGAVGAAWAFTLGQGAAMLFFIVATPRTVRLPVNIRRATALALTGIAIVAVGQGVKFAISPALATTLNLLLIAAGSAFFLIRWNLFDARVIGQRLRRFVTNRLSGS